MTFFPATAFDVCKSGETVMRMTRVTQYLALTGALLALPISALGQKDSGVRGGIQNTGGGLQQQGIPIPHPPVISPNPTTGATINDNEFASFLEGILRAGQLESTCDDCADVTDGSPVVNMGELDPVFPSFTRIPTVWARGTMRTSVLPATRNPCSVGRAASSFLIRATKRRKPRKTHSFAWCLTVMAGRIPSLTLSISTDPSVRCASNASPTEPRRWSPSTVDRARQHERFHHS